MRRSTLLVLVSVAVVLQLSSRAAVQGPSLAVRASAPVGELAQISDGAEIRITFSEPMVALGGAVTGRPSWITISPAIDASYYWNGTSTLLVSAVEGQPLRFSTRYEVTIDRGATSVAGRTLTTPHAFAFTTPTPRVLSAQFYRKTRRYDSPAVIALRFNQPMRAADVVAHTHIAHQPHSWTPPTLNAAGRQRLAATDAPGLARFDQKVADVARVAALSDPVPFVAASAGPRGDAASGYRGEVSVRQSAAIATRPALGDTKLDDRRAGRHTQPLRGRSLRLRVCAVGRQHAVTRRVRDRPDGQPRREWSAADDRCHRRRS